MDLLHEENVVRIKIIGVGGGGTNALECMVTEHIPLVEYISVNTDDGAVTNSHADTSLQIGLKLTSGRGAGADPEIGKLAAEEDLNRIEKAIEGCDMLFIVAGMGGGTGTGAAPVIAEIARNLGILSVAVVTKPFYFEGKRRINQAESGIAKLAQSVDSIIVIPNDNLKHMTTEKLTFENAMSIADDVLLQTVKNIVEVIQTTAVVNCDFADIHSVISNAGYMHTAIARGVYNGYTDDIIRQLVASKLLGTTVDNATGVLLYFSAKESVALDEIEKISSAISSRVAPDANVIFGMNMNDSMENEMKVVLIATHGDKNA